MSSHFNYYSQVPGYYGVDNGGSPLQSDRLPAIPQQFQQYSAEDLNANFPEFEGAAGMLLPAQGSVRGRRRMGSLNEHVKHRRTRSGCYTCRNRRVKCDEAHPMCERCRKGNRDCIYPEPSSSTKSRRSSTKSKDAATESPSSGEELEEGTTSELLPIPDDDEDTESPSEPSTASNVLFPGQYARDTSDPPSLTHGKSPTPSSTEGSSSSNNITAMPAPQRLGGDDLTRPKVGRKWSQLPQDIHFYLNYHRKHMSHHHYGLKHDPQQFFKNTYLEIALRSEPLLYAVVGYAAYHHTINKSNGRIHDFLHFYNTSVTLLRRSLQEKQKHTVATLLTVLQLASIEERLGDWVNLVRHQKAAYQLLSELYTPTSIMQNDTVRKAFAWYVRFDVMAGMLSGHETNLGREWFVASNTFYMRATHSDPSDLDAKYDLAFSASRLIGTDMAILFARKARGTISEADYLKEIAELDNKLGSWREKLDPALLDESKLVTDFSGAPALDPDDIVDPYNPPCLYNLELWTTNFLLMSYSALEIMYKYYLAAAEQRPPPPDVLTTALWICQVFEAIQNWPKTPVGSVLTAQGDMGLATLFLPPEPRYTNWARKKLAGIEALGYTYPETLRKKMGHAWKVDVSEGWLPYEYLPPVVKTLRAFIQERATAPRDQAGEDINDLKGLFASIALKDDSENSSPGETRIPADFGEGGSPVWDPHHPSR